LKPGEEFAQLWELNKDRLGCPVQPKPIGGYFVEQPFERGWMYWSEIPDWILVLIDGDGGDRGTCYLSKELWDHAWAGCVPLVTPEPGTKPIQPVGGFGSLWCRRVDIQRAIGFGVKNEQGVYKDLLQEFERGLLLLGDDKAVYALFVQGEGTTKGLWENWGRPR
jgi:hypothetical protein